MNHIRLQQIYAKSRLVVPITGGSRDEEYDTDRAGDACGSDNET